MVKSRILEFKGNVQVYPVEAICNLSSQMSTSGDVLPPLYVSIVVAGLLQSKTKDFSCHYGELFTKANLNKKYKCRIVAKLNQFVSYNNEHIYFAVTRFLNMG